MNTLDIAMLGLWVATVAQIAFVILYATGPWWRHFVGRALFSKSFVLAVTLAVTLVNNYVIYRYQLEVGAFLMWAIALAIVWQLVALIRQRLIDRGRAD